MSTIVEGIATGLGLATIFGFGPALFAMVQTSINKGFSSAVLLAVGVFFSDLILVALAYVGIIQIVNQPANKLAFGIISGIILILFGFYTYRKEVSLQPAETKINFGKLHSVKCFFKGFFLNIANPFIWILWMGMMVTRTTISIGHPTAIVVFFAAALLTVLSMDILKCLGAFKIKRFLTYDKLRVLNHLTGIGLSGAGVFLILRVVYNVYF